MNWLRVKDNSAVEKSDFSVIPNLSKHLADKTLKQLEREGVFMLSNSIQNADDVTEDQMVLQGFNSCYRTSNIMGFFGLGWVVTSRGTIDHLAWYRRSAKGGTASRLSRYR